jgi:pilus assembly protein FimV
MLGRTSSLIVCAALFPIGAAAMSLGRTTSVASLGQALQFRVPITLESGETILPECIAVQVTHGESRLDPQVVRYTLEPERAPGVQMLAVRTLVPIEELVLQVTVGIGCPPRYTRSYTLFPDPPTVTLAAVPAAPAADMGAAPSPGDGASSSPPLAAAADTAAAAPPPAASRPAPRPPPRPKVRPPSRATAKSASRPAAVAAAAPSPRVPAAARAAVPSTSRAAVAAGGARLLLDPTSPRLKLDLDEPVFMGPAASSVATASAEDALELQRLKALESTLSQLQQEGQRQRTNNAQLQKQLQSAQADQRWVPWLIGLLALSLAAVAALAWRLRRRAQSQDWWGASAAESSLAPLAPPVPPQEDDDDADLPIASRVQATLPPDDDEWRAGRGAAFATAAAYGEAPPTMPLGITASDLGAAGSETPTPAPSPAARRPSRDVDSAFDWKTSTAVRLGGVELPREMAVEELLDLEQQADFFIALGQEDAAIELLMVHLRSTRGMSPLPYTQLLELYRKLGDKEAYEKIRSRFNRQFNAHAPDWDAGPSQGRTLEEYPAIVESVQGLWATPPEAMKALEAMLIRRDDQSELFDLPAYRDLLMLYALARDLAQQRDDAPRDVDVMLPLSPDTEFGRYLENESLDFDLTRPIDAPPTPGTTQSAAFRSTDSDPNFDIKLK